MDRIRNITACKRCREKRIKCDKKFPQCSNCVKKGFDCVSIDVGTGEIVSRSYVHDLETKVRELEKQVEQLRKKGESRIDPQSHIESQTESCNESAESKTKSIDLKTTDSIDNGSSNGDVNYKVMLMTDDDIRTVKNLPHTELPEKKMVEQCIEQYFQISNLQLPILNSTHYLLNYFKPLYGESERLWSKYVGDATLHSDVDVEDKNHKQCCLFFLYIILAISTSFQHNQSSSSEAYQQKSLKYADYLWKNDTTSDIKKIERMQSLLLLSAYSLMRPSNPGSWYLIGNAIRLMYDLGFNEDPVSEDVYIVDMKRRMFWCCYSLDRQVSSYFRKPFGISDMKVKEPSVFSDEEICNRLPGLETGPNSDKLVMIHYLKLRMLQSDIFLVQDLSQRDEIFHRLTSWWLEIDQLEPSEFDRLILNVIYHYSVVNLYKFILFQPELNDYANKTKFQLLIHHCQQVVENYYTIQEKNLLNYSWVSINNMFSPGITYLFTIYYCDFIRTEVDLVVLQGLCTKVEVFLDKLKPICYQQCVNYIKDFTDLKDNVIDLIRNERKFVIDLDIFDDSEFINFMVGSVNKELDPKR